MESRVFVVALAAAIAAWCVARALVHRPTSLAVRLQPYTSVARARLGTVRPEPVAPAAPKSAVALVFGPLVRRLADGLARLVDVSSPVSAELRLRQAGLSMTVDRYRTRQLAYAAGGAGVGALAGLALGHRAGVVMLLALGAGFWGATRCRARVQRLITRRRERMRAELYTVCQLLAVYLRTGDTPAGAVHRLVRRGNGEIVGELADASAQIRRGSQPAAAFEAVTSTSPEPTAGRLYRLLASTWVAGGDPDALLALAEDVRSSRREELQRQMAKRQTAMALSLVMVVGPILILFIAAAIPHLVFGR
jgi:tight adherence protein C